MKKIFLAIFMLLAANAFAQTDSEDDVIGVYKLPSDDPMGGVTMVFMEDHTVVIAYFGGVQNGTWELKDQKILFTLGSEPQFALYGRNLKDLNNKTRINFLVEPDNGAMVGLDSNKKTSLKPVFNQSANCFSYPYIFSQEKELIQLHAAQAASERGNYDSEGKPYAQVYHFNVFRAFNDLVLINLPSEYTTKSTSQAMYKDGMLFMEPGEEGTPKRPLESLNEEDIAFIKQFSNKSLLPDQLQHGDDFFPYTENPTEEELNPYNRIDVLEISIEGITVLEDSFFTVTCDED